VEVECYTCHRSEETAWRFRLAGQQIETAEIVDRWLAPDHRDLKVQDTQGDLYSLRNNAAFGQISSLWRSSLEQA
jgi:hypothetical protein